MVARLPAQTHALYAELLERLLAESARHGPGKTPGTFVHKTIKGESYVYFQFSEPGGRVRQLYLGKKGPAMESLIKRFKDEKPQDELEHADIERLSAQLRIGGAWTMGPRPARVLSAFASAGLFETGAVLVGTHAFGVIGNMLGARWEGAHVRTQDLDLAAVAMTAADATVQFDAPSALQRLELGFLPVPALDPRHPSTSFKVRGEALRVDFLTPGKEGRPVTLPRLGTAAQPLPFLDYLLENPERAAVVDGGGFLVLVPSPARFALHKALIAQERPISQLAKSSKDLAQAAEVAALLAEDRPGELTLAFDAIKARGWEKRFRIGWQRLAKSSGLSLPEL